MKSFPHRNTTGKDVCPVCKTNDDGETVLIGVAGTQEGHNIQAVQVHLKCLELLYYPGMGLIAQKV